MGLTPCNGLGGDAANLSRALPICGVLRQGSGSSSIPTIQHPSLLAPWQWLSFRVFSLWSSGGYKQSPGFDPYGEFDDDDDDERVGDTLLSSSSTECNKIVHISSLVLVGANDAVLLGHPLDVATLGEETRWR